jgi:hypothetical protein
VISGDNIANLILDTSPGVSILSDEEIERIISGIDLSDLQSEDPEEAGRTSNPRPEGRS